MNRRRNAMLIWRAACELSGFSEYNDVLQWIRSFSDVSRELGRARQQLKESAAARLLAERKCRRFQAELLLAIGELGEAV